MEMDTYVNIHDTLNTTRRLLKDPEYNRKLFIGSLDDSATNDSLQAYFEQWGEVVDVVVMKDPITKRSKGFGFITYSQSSMVDRAMSKRPHIINGREVETKRKRAVSRDNICEPNISTTVKNIYVYGIKEISENDLLEYFGKFGNIINIKIITDKDSGKRKGFGFIEYDDARSVDKAVLLNYHQINGERMIVNKAIRRVDGPGGSLGGHGDRVGAVFNSSLKENPQNGQCEEHHNKSNGADGAYGNSGTVRGCSYVGNVVGYGGSTVVYNSNYGSAWQGAPQRWVNNNPSWGNQRGGSGASLQRPSYNLDPNQSYDHMKAFYTSQYSASYNQIGGGPVGPQQPCYSLNPNQISGPTKSYYTSNYRATSNGNPETDYKNAGEM